MHNDTSKAKRGPQDIMIKFVKSTSDCKRENYSPIYFGYQAPNRTDGGHDCCDYHSERLLSSTKWDVDKKMGVANPFEEPCNCRTRAKRYPI